MINKNRIKLFIKDNNESQIITNDLKKILIANNYIIDDNNYDLAFSIGGDGTFIKMLHENNFNNDILYCGINAGNLGFLNTIDYDDILLLINSLNNNDIKKYKLNYLNISITTKKDIIKYNAINEIIVRNTNYNVLHLPIYVNDTLFEMFHGDGILICTPTGSTAHNISLNGPIICNNIESMVITSIAPINNKIFKSINNSLVLSKEDEIKLIPKNNNDLCLIIDGKVIKIEDITNIEISLSNEKINCIYLNQYDNIKQINNKLIN